ncbi:hypothetical protein ACTPEF_27460, partial [Clostridioides difficile]
LPIVFLDNSLCNLASLFNDFLRYLGFSINSPQLEIQNSLIPKFKSKKINRFSYKTNFTNGNIMYCGQHIKLPKLGMVKIRD